MLCSVVEMELDFGMKMCIRDRPGMEPYYPVNNERNNDLFEKYKALADKEEKVIFGGRLGNYKYYDMDKVIIAALEAVEKYVR